MVTAANRLTANQVVAYNLARIRKTHGLTQEQAAERLAPYVGATWSKKVYSAAERSFAGGRVRQFTADDLAAFSLAFGVPVWFFFVPPKPDDRAGADGVQSGDREVAYGDFLANVVGGGDHRMAVFMRIMELPADERPPRLSPVSRVLTALTIGDPA